MHNVLVELRDPVPSRMLTAVPARKHRPITMLTLDAEKYNQRFKITISIVYLFTKPKLSVFEVTDFCSSSSFWIRREIVFIININWNRELQRVWSQIDEKAYKYERNSYSVSYPMNLAISW